MPPSIQQEHSILVPGSQAKERIFPFLDVTSALCSEEELNDHYNARVHFMMCLVENHSTLSNSADLISYSLLMAGTTPEKAVPSIVITTTPSIVKELRLLFDYSHAVNHNQCKRTGGLCESSVSHTEWQDVPRFLLVYYATDHPQIVRTAGEDTCATYYRNESTMCGALLEYQTRISTLGLVLQVNSDMRGLTVDHLFNPVPKPRRTRPPEESQESSHRLENADSTNNREVFRIRQPWINNIDGIDLPEVVPETKHQNNSFPLPNSIDNDRIGAQQLIRYAQKVETLEDLPHPEPYLDWALVKFVPRGSFPGCVNLFWPYGPSEGPVMLQDIAETPPHSRVPVFIISGQSGVTSGVMLGNVSYIASNDGKEACKVWRVIPESSNRISKGDSGSIVVDKETFHVYGHIIGTNPLSQACVVPLVETIRQVTHCFRDARVTLPSNNAYLYGTNDIGADRQFWAMQPMAFDHTDTEGNGPTHLTAGSTQMNLTQRPMEVHFPPESGGQFVNVNVIQQQPELRRLSLRDYTAGWLCALPEELAAAQILLDEKHENLPHDPHDETQYTLGSIGNHNVVIGCLSAGQIGMGSAAMVATRMCAKFPNIRFGLMVGIGSGVANDKDVRLGDIVVSQPYGGHGGVIQYDFGRSEAGGFVHTGFLNTPPHALLQALANLQARHFLEDNNIQKYLSVVERRDRFKRPNPNSDILFHDTYEHIEGEKTCERCDKFRTVSRRPREHNNVVVHYGTIASGNRVIESATERNLLNSQFKGVLCFEMEAAGLLNTWPCLVIRGISDYADSHKNDEWKLYAAGAAAAFAKELLLCIAPAAVENEQSIGEMTVSGSPTSSRSPIQRVSSNNSVGNAELDAQGRIHDRTSSIGSADTLQRVAFENRDRQGWTQLHHAAFGGDERMVNDLLGLHVSTTIRDNSGRTPLHIAAYNGQDTIVKLLLQSGADKDSRDFDKQTPLYLAASQGLMAMAEVFINEGADLEIADKHGKTPLYAAAQNGHEAVARLLVQKGANKEAAKVGGWVPLHAAAWNGHEPVVKLLLELQCKREARSNEGKTPLYAAAKQGHEGVARLLLESEAEKDVSASGGWTPLHAAAWDGHEGAVRALLDYGAYMEARSQRGETPLFSAARRGHVAIVELLVERGAQKNVKANDGVSVMEVAKVNGHHAVVSVLKSRRWFGM